ncbi:terminase small subunit [Bacillus cereus]
MKLTPKQQRFCDYYIETGNATEAYKRAGYSHKNDNVAGVEGKKLLRNPKIERYVREHMEAIRSPVIASQEEVLERLTSVLREKVESSKDLV